MTFTRATLHGNDGTDTAADPRSADDAMSRADELGCPPDGEPDRPRGQASDLGDIAEVLASIDAAGSESLVEDVDRNAVEEHVHRDQDHDEVVEAAEQGDLVRNEVSTDEEIARRGAQGRLSGDRNARVGQEIDDEAGVDRRSSRERQEGQVAERAAGDEPPGPGSGATDGRRRIARSTRHRRPSVPTVAGLDIERPFGIMAGPSRKERW
jgi:hypothetical protein